MTKRRHIGITISNTRLLSSSSAPSESGRKKSVGGRVGSYKIILKTKHGFAWRNLYIPMARTPILGASHCPYTPLCWHLTTHYQNKFDNFQLLNCHTRKLPPPQCHCKSQPKTNQESYPKKINFRNFQHPVLLLEDSLIIQCTEGLYKNQMP